MFEEAGNTEHDHPSSRKWTNNLARPSSAPGRDFTIDIYERSGVPKWKFTRPIIRSIMSLFVRKLIDADSQDFTLLAAASYPVIIIKFVG